MTERTVELEADDEAFRDWWVRATESLHRVGRHSPYYAESLSRQAFDAGMKRGLEKRGCCHEHDPETVVVAVVREAMEGTDADGPA